MGYIFRNLEGTGVSCRKYNFGYRFCYYMGNEFVGKP
jgi:hypothetical protein